MGNSKNRWASWTPENPVLVAAPLIAPESNTPKYRTDNADNAVQTNSIVGAVGAIVEDISPEQPDLKNVIPVRDGTDLEQLAYEVRDARLIAESRGKAVELQVWLTTHESEHMQTEPHGLSSWISTLIEFDVLERGRLREILHFKGCIHDHGLCPTDAPVNCSDCTGKVTGR